MKRKILLLAVLWSLLGCNKISNDVDIVKNGTMSLDKSLTVGQAIDNYKYFKSTKWESTKSDNGRNLVNATGTLDVSRFPYLNTYEIPELKSAYITFQFIVTRDKTFDMKWCGIGFESNDGKKKEPEQQANLQECTNTLREIYNNGPKELSAEKIAEFQHKAGCEELTKYMKIGKTAMEAYFADYQKYSTIRYGERETATPC